MLFPAVPVVKSTGSSVVPLLFLLISFHVPHPLECFSVVTPCRVSLPSLEVTFFRRRPQPNRCRRRRWFRGVTVLDGSVEPTSQGNTGTTDDALSLLLNESTGSSTKQLQHVVVVGAGVGGLAVASRIASGSNAKVTVLEKNAQTGGRCGSSFVTTLGDDNTNTNDTTTTTGGSKRGTLLFRHERGPSLLLLPRVYHDFFVDLNTTASAHGLEWKACIPAYTVVFDDGDSIAVGFPNRTSDNDIQQHQQQQQEWIRQAHQESQQTMNRWEHNGAQKWDEYMKLCRAYLQCGLPNFIEERFDPTGLPNFVYEAVWKDQGRGWPLKPHGDVLQSFFTSIKLQALASFPDLYVGLVPYRDPSRLWNAGGVLDSTAPAVFGLLSALELHPTYPDSGVFAPIGGFEAVSTSLERVATQQCGVNILTGCTVTRVTNDGVWYQQPKQDQDEKGHCSTDSNMTFLPADLVIVNADLPYATVSLLDKRGVENDNSTVSGRSEFDWNDDYRYSSGVVAFHWCVDRPWSSLNSTHAVFLSTNTSTQAMKSWDTVRGTTSDRPMSFLASVDDPFNFYVHRASHSDPTAAPKGMDSITVLVPCPTLRRDPLAATLPRDQAMERYQAQFGSDDPTLIDRVRAAVLHRLSVVLPRSDIVILHETVDTPATYADQYHVGAGSPFGLSHGLGQLSLFRPSPQSSTHSNAMFCGASTRPGNGVPLVLIGAKLVAEQALAKLRQT